MPISGIEYGASRAGETIIDAIEHVCLMTSQDEINPDRSKEKPPELPVSGRADQTDLPDQIDTVNPNLAMQLTASVISALAESESLLPEGNVIAGKYKILGHLGSGGMSVVYKARDQVIGRDVALKMLSAERAADAKSVRRFQQEGMAIGRLNHPNIVSVHDVGVTATGEPFFVMDLADGKTLGEVVSFSGRCSPLRALALIENVLDALIHAHEKGVVHRDLKPGNIIVCNSVDGNGEKALVFDFGIAKLMPEPDKTPHDLTQTGEVFGSPLYMSPEQCLGKALDGRSDIYSLACILYELISGHPPHRSETTVETIIKHVQEEAQPLSQACPELLLPAGLEALVQKGLSKNPQSRFQSASEMRQAISSVIEKSRSDKAPMEAKAKLFGILERDPASITIGSLIVLVPVVLVALLLWSISGFSSVKQAPPIRADLSSGTLRHMVDHAQLQTESENGVHLKEVPAFTAKDGAVMFNSERIDDTVMGRLTNTKDLRKLVFKATSIEITARVLEYVSTLPIDYLDLSESDFSLDFLREVSKIRTLRTLDLANITLSEGQMEIVCQSRSLENLSINGSRRPMRVLLPLTHLPRLRCLNLSDCGLSDQFMNVIGACKGLVQLTLAHNPVGAAGLEKLDGLPDLEVLDLSGTRVTDKDIDALAAFPSLKNLSLDKCNLSNAALLKLARLSNLRKLSLANCQRLTDTAIARLKASLPHCVITP